jgi:hypothetical protein
MRGEAERGRSERERREHEEYRFLAAAAVDGRLDADGAAALEAHLATCPDCRADQQAMLEDHVWLATPGPVAPPDSRIRDLVLGAARSERVPRTSDLGRPWAALAAATLIVAVAGGGVLLANLPGSGSGGPGPAVTPTALPSSTPELLPSPSPTPFPIEQSPSGGPCAPRPQGLAAWWTGDDARDLVGGGEAILHGNVTVTPGLVGSALTFDGVTGYAEVPHDPALDLGTRDFTIMLWVRYAGMSGEQVLIEQWRDPAPSVPAAGWTLTKLVDQVLLFTSESLGSGQGASSPVLDLRPGAWYHVAVRRSGTEIRLYVNAMEVGVGSAPAPVDMTLDTSLLLGRRGNDSGFLLDGQLDEVQIVTGRALFATDIQAAYVAGSNGTCAG